MGTHCPLCNPILGKEHPCRGFNAAGTPSIELWSPPYLTDLDAIPVVAAPLRTISVIKYYVLLGTSNV